MTLARFRSLAVAARLPVATRFAVAGRFDMEQRALGKSGIRASRIGLGCATFGREIPEEAAFRIMDYAVERNITLFDTAEAYGGGQARQYRMELLGVDDVREVSG